jgi:hypothetical protein
MKILEVIRETDKAMLVVVEYEDETFRFWAPKSVISGFDIDDTFAMEKIESNRGSYQDPDNME